MFARLSPTKELVIAPVELLTPTIPPMFVFTKVESI